MNHLFCKKLGIWGFGIVGQSAMRLARSRGCKDLIIIDKKLDSATHIHSEDRPFIQFFIESPDTQKQMLTFCDFIILSPGIDVRAYQEYAHKFVSELDIFNYYATSPTIAITGSVGKTTITTLLGSLLMRAGLAAQTAGNIGNGMLDLIIHEQVEAYSVLEVSSFQLESVQFFSPDIAIICNIHPNHLDRHGTMLEYIQAKSRVLLFQKPSGYSILPWELKDTFLDENKFLSQKIWHHPHRITADFILGHTGKEKVYTLFENSIVCVHNGLFQEVISLNQLPDISLIANWIILIATLETLGIKTASLISSNTNLTIPRHRIEHIGTYNDISFYNDSKSTIPASTLAAIEKLNTQQLVLFIGGVGKGVDRQPFIQLLAGKVSTLYCFGSEAQTLAEYARMHAITTHTFETLENAVDTYFINSKKGDHVLFSPAGASFDLFTNYQHRGETFKDLVHKHMNI